MAVDQLSQWLFTPDELRATPSMCDGLDPAEERCRRAKGVNFILQVGILLKLPQMTIGVASTFFHRFYMRRSMVEKKGGLHHYVSRPSTSSGPSEALSSPSVSYSPYHPSSNSHRKFLAAEWALTHFTPEQSLAATSLFLATKTEECCRKTKEIVIAVAKVAQKNASLIIDEQSKEYWRWRDAMLLYEEQMLEVLTFDLVVKPPYNFLIEALKSFSFEENKHVRNVAWAFVNDSAMTMICLAMPPKDIAVGALYFAIKFNNETVPDDEETGAPWWEVLGGSPERIMRAVGFMNEFWSDNPLRKAETPYAGYTSSSDDLERTRRRAGSEGSSIISPPSVNGDSIVSPKRGRDGATEERRTTEERRAMEEQRTSEEGPRTEEQRADDALTADPSKPHISNGTSTSTSKRKDTEDREEEPAPKRARTEEAVSEDGAVEEAGEVEPAS